MKKPYKILIGKRFSGTSLPVGSKLGRILINSADSMKIADAVRAAIMKGPQTVQLSSKTQESIQSAEMKER